MRIALLAFLAGLARARNTDGPSDFDISCYDEKDKGKTYQGLMNFASSGRACQNWVSQHPHPHDLTPLPGNGLGNHNYCRNPDGSEAKPWCYTTDPSPDHARETCTIPTCPPAARDYQQEARFLAAGMPDVDLGPVSYRDGQMEVRPQMKVAVGSKNWEVEAGLHDVRDGLKVNAAAKLFSEVDAVGHNVLELHGAIRCDDPGFKEALGVATQLLDQGTHSAIKLIAEALGLDPARVEHVIAGEANRSGDEAKLRVKFKIGVGAGAEVRLGWCDTEGYRMVGVGGEASHALGLQASVFAGEHDSGSFMKIIISISSFMFEYTLPTA